MLRDPSEHPRADFFIVMERKYEIWPASPCKNPV
jgi:hypothetical protein